MSTTKTPLPYGMTQQQLEMFRMQTLASRTLSRNLPLPPDLEKKIIDEAGVQQASNLTPLQRKAMLIKICNTPEPVYQAITKEIQELVSDRIEARINEIRSILSQPLPTDVKTKLLIESKQLGLLSLQRKLRLQYLQEQHKLIELDNPETRLLYRRQVRFTNKDVVATDNKTYLTSKAHKKNRQAEFLKLVLEHAIQFRQIHSDRKKDQQRLCKAVLNHHLNQQRIQQAAKERQEKERLRALKSNDEEGYMKLLQETKNERLMLLMKQTGEYLDKLADSIETLKEATKERRRQEAITKGQTDEVQPSTAKVVDMETDDKVLTNIVPVKSEAAEDQNMKIMRADRYMKVTHSVVEEVTTQPAMLKGGKLKSYQLVGLRWLVSLYNNGLNGVLADEMGLGKTIQTIGLLCYLVENKNNNGPFLVGCPLSTMMNWRDEFTKWAPDMRVVVYRGDPKQRKDIYHHQLAEGKFNVVLTTYEYFLKDKAVLDKIQWQYIIIDEGHRIKNHQSKLSTTLSTYYKSYHRILLTGTPLQNNLPELWSLLNFLLPSVFNSCDTFEQWFNAPFANTGGSMELNEEETLLLINRLHKLLRPFLLRRLKKDVESELPDKTEKILRVELSSVQKRLYESVQARNTSSLAGLKVQAVNNIVMQLRKVCNHPYLFPGLDRDGEPMETLIRVSGKFALLDNIIPKMKATGHRILMFCQMTNLMTILEDMLTYRGYKYLRLDGATKAETRGELLTLFNRKDSPYFMFLLSTRAGGLGLNLQTADTVIIFDSDWNPHMDLQAQDRAHRIGQTHEVRVLRLVTASPVENAILERATHKLTMDAKVIQAGLFNTTSTAEDRRSMLETLVRAKPGSDSSDVANLEEINNIIARSDDEFEKFQQMDVELAAARQQSWEAAGNTGPCPPLLMKGDELPAWMKEAMAADAAATAEEGRETPGPEEFGRGHRRKSSNVIYTDGLTDLQWIRLMDSGADMMEAIEKKRANRSTPTVKRKRKLLEDGTFGPEEDESSNVCGSELDLKIETPAAPKPENQPAAEDEEAIIKKPRRNRSVRFDDDE